MADFTRTLSSYKELFLSEVKKLNDFIKSENQELRTALQSAESNTEANEAHLKDEQVQMDTMQRILAAVKGEVAALHAQIQNLTAVKVEDSLYKKDLDFFRQEHLNLRYAI